MFGCQLNKCVWISFSEYSYIYISIYLYICILTYLYIYTFICPCIYIFRYFNSSPSFFYIQSNLKVFCIISIQFWYSIMTVKWYFIDYYNTDIFLLLFLFSFYLFNFYFAVILYSFFHFYFCTVIIRILCFCSDVFYYYLIPYFYGKFAKKFVICSYLKLLSLLLLLFSLW